MKKNIRYLKICLVLFTLSFFSVSANAQTAEVQKLLDDAYAKGEFSGVVLAARGDEIVFRGAVGKANRQWNINNQLSTKFRICSVTKQFTAMLVMQMVEAGKISLDAPIADYLPEFRKDTGGKFRFAICF